MCIFLLLIADYQPYEICQYEMRDKNVSFVELQGILEYVSDGIVLFNRDGVVTWSNKPFEKFAASLGFDAYGTPMEAISSMSGAGLPAIAMQVGASGDAHTCEVFIPSHNLWFLAQLSPCDGGVSLLMRDITEQKASDHVLIDERNLRILINITDHPIWLVDVNCNIVICNNAFKKWILNFAGKEIGNGDNVLDEGLDEMYLSKLKACFQLALQGKNFTAIEDIKVGNEIKFTTINFNPVFDKGGAVVGISCHASDITDHRKNLSQIEAQTNLLLEIANIQSHKVRGPVATLLGLVQIFNFEDISDPGNMEVMNGVAEVTSKLDEIVKEVIRSINLLSYRTGKSRE